MYPLVLYSMNEFTVILNTPKQTLPIGYREPLNEINTFSIIKNNSKNMFSHKNITILFLENVETDWLQIVELYLKYGFEYILQLMNGKITFLLYDNNSSQLYSKLFIARDCFGQYPLYFGNIMDNQFGISTLKHCLINPILKNTPYHETGKEIEKIQEFPIGSYVEFSLHFNVLAKWKQVSPPIKYFQFPFVNFFNKKDKFIIETEMYDISKQLQKRVINSIQNMFSTNPDYTPACLLSGGLNSGIVASLLCNEYMRKGQSPKRVFTYCIGFKNSEDIKYARITANHLGTTHTEIIIDETEYLKTVNIAIQILETADIKTIRAGVFYYLAVKYIKNKSNATHIIDGYGADEYMGGNLYMHLSPDMIDFDNMCRMNLTQFHEFYGKFFKITNFFNLTRVSPFMDTNIINYYLSIPPQFRWNPGSLQVFDKYKLIEKYLLRFAFSDYLNVKYNLLLPEDILWRTKEEFFDGITCFQEPIYKMISKELENQNQSRNEIQYYSHLFHQIFGYTYDKINMFQYIETAEPSAYSLDFYFDYNPDYQDRTI